MAARRLRGALEDYGIAAQIVEGYGVALVLGGADLASWGECGPEGWRFRWRTGHVSATTGNWTWTVCPMGAGQTAARQIAERYLQACSGGHRLAAVGADAATVPAALTGEGRGAQTCPEPEVHGSEHILRSHSLHGLAEKLDTER
ncbi:hypothetical protein ABT294_05280 [Nonomuraea sp. NPDC000554]|uniref:hypothetical protein n=1 Tax=Nonomuraea sp. NPDC000554 TaxID=3154259 RepID=UPI0033189D42